MGVSGFIEVVGLTLWGYELVANMRAGKRLEKEPISPKAIGEITPTTRVANVLARYPQSLEIFLRRGFTPLRNPVLRKTLARAITVEQACRREGVNLSELLGELRQMAEHERAVSQPLVSITRNHQAQLI
jgi:hypothetical protein